MLVFYFLGVGEWGTFFKKKLLSHTSQVWGEAALLMSSCYWIGAIFTRKLDCQIEEFFIVIIDKMMLEAKSDISVRDVHLIMKDSHWAPNHQISQRDLNKARSL